MKEGLIEEGDMVVSRVNGTADHYVVGKVSPSPTTGRLTLIDVQPMIGRDSAIQRGYARNEPEHKVWLFDGMEASDLLYSEAPRITPK